MDTDARVAAGQPGHRKGVVDLGGGGIVDTEGIDLCEREIVRNLCELPGRKCRSPREMVEQEAVEMIVRGRRQRSATLGQPCRGELLSRTRFIERLPFDRIVI